MKEILFVLLLVVVNQLANAQTVFWSETFENGCSSGCAATGYSGPNGAWSVTNTGTNGGNANVWYVSCAENGQASGVCGAGCGSDESMHVGSSFYGDLGAAYLAGGMGTNPETNRRVNSPVIDCSGRSNITLSFVYIENGDGVTDNATLKISYNGGTTWNDLADMGKTTLCGGGQGLWQTYSMVLPAAANNNANLRLGFNWTNNNNSGTDPSFAVDDVQLSVVSPMPVELIGFDGNCIGDHQALISWSTASEINNSHFEIEKASDGVQFNTAYSLSGAGNSNAVIDYQQIVDVPANGAWFRLKQVDFDGQFSWSESIYLSCNQTGDLKNTIVQYQQEDHAISLSNLPQGVPVAVTLFDAGGRAILTKDVLNSETEMKLYCAECHAGLYMLSIVSQRETFSVKLVIQ